MRDQPLAVDFPQAKRDANAHVEGTAACEFTKVAIEAVRKSSVAIRSHAEIAHIDSGRVFKRAEP
jgi:hypothetical protein